MKHNKCVLKVLRSIRHNFFKSVMYFLLKPRVLSRVLLTQVLGYNNF